jgi:hypothetical protein
MGSACLQVHASVGAFLVVEPQCVDASGSPGRAGFEEDQGGFCGIFVLVVLRSKDAFMAQSVFVRVTLGGYGLGGAPKASAALQDPSRPRCRFLCPHCPGGFCSAWHTFQMFGVGFGTLAACMSGSFAFGGSAGDTFRGCGLLASLFGQSRLPPQDPMWPLCDPNASVALSLSCARCVAQERSTRVSQPLST